MHLRTYHEQPGATLYQGDALDLLREFPAESCDALVTDPPYSSGAFVRADKAIDPRSKYCQHNNDQGRPTFVGDNRDGRSWSFWCTLWLAQCFRIVRQGGYALVFTDWRQLPLLTDAFQAAGFLWRGLIAWDKTTAARAPHCGYYRHQCEYIVWGTKGPIHNPGAGSGGPYPGCLREPVRQRDKLHMTGKPTPLMRALLGPIPAGGVVLDPFAGSGTTGVACLQTGREFVGIEASKAYCAIAIARLQQVSTRREDQAA